MDDPRHLAAPMTGVVTLAVEVGQTVEEGDTIATLEAMKLVSHVSAPQTGTVARIAAPSGSHLEAGDLIAVVTPGSGSGSDEP